MEEEKRNEAAFKYNEQFIGGQESRYAAEDFIAGADWQKEQMYSDSDMRIAFDANIKDWISYEEFIEQFICNNQK